LPELFKFDSFEFKTGVKKTRVFLKEIPGIPTNRWR
jgi:hypothetical protein